MLTAAALDLARTDAWLSGVPVARTRTSRTGTSRFAALRGLNATAATTATAA